MASCFRFRRNITIITPGRDRDLMNSHRLFFVSENNAKGEKSVDRVSQKKRRWRERDRQTNIDGGEERGI